MTSATHLSHADFRAGTRALLGLCALEAAIFLAVIGLQKVPTVAAAIPSAPAAQALFAGIILAILVITVLLRIYRRATASERYAFSLGLAANLLTVVLALVAAETGLRLAASTTSDGLALGPVTLPPTWSEIRARNAALLKASSGPGDAWLSYVVSDPELGWSVGANRRASGGMYYSSAEGLRSDGPDVVYATRRPPLRIALVGDSFTFSMDVPFRDSWGYQLEQLLGPDTQVLNFGVDGYGVDQAWLRYRRDVRPWRPDVVLFGLIQHDLLRSVAVYPAISFNWKYPFAKPRFVQQGEELRLINMPLTTPREILAQADISGLPFIDYDLGYQRHDWRWRGGDLPVLVRLFGAAFPRWPTGDSRVSDEVAIRLGGRILREFQEQAPADGVRARILYFPTEGAGDFGGKVSMSSGIAREMLARDAPGYLDLTGCVTGFEPADRHVAGSTHYTGMANGSIAGCVAGDLKRRGWLETPGQLMHPAAAAAQNSKKSRPVGGFPD